MTDASLNGKVIIVTGAAQGIGRGIADMAVARGARVAAIDLNGAALDAMTVSDESRLLRQTGSVSDPDFAQQAVARTVAQFGAVHGLVNNAGIIRPAMIEKMSVAAWREVIDVHLSGSFYFLQAVGRQMLDQAQAQTRATGFNGSIVNISSDAGRRGTVGQINYAAAKAGIFGLTMSAAREWAKHGIRVNTVCFGVVETPMTETIRSERFRDTYLAQIPLGRWSTPDEVARPVCFLLSDEASYVTGQHLSVNGGYTIGL